MSCSNNLKQLGIACHSYHDANNALPPGCANDVAPFGTGGNGWGSSWKVYILPYIEQQNVFNQWRFVSSSGYTNASPNVNLINRVTIKTYRCPSSPLPDFYTNSNNSGSIEMFTSYVGVAGSAIDTTKISVTECCGSGGSGIGSAGGILFPRSQVTMVGITDGTSNTILVGEQGDHLRDSNNRPITGPYAAITSQGPHGWTMGCYCDTASWPINRRAFNTTTVRYTINQHGMTDNGSAGTNNNTGVNIPFSSGHTGGANMLFADGSVRFMSNSTPLLTLQWLATRAGGETLPNF
jgi:prepilin-type processing-associated H-X9-DG protein